MLSAIRSAQFRGIDAAPVTVETDISNGIPFFSVVGRADPGVREAKERIRAALRNTGLRYPTERITINLAPAGIRKSGSHFDLPMALGILCASAQLPPEALAGAAFVGELSLDGKIEAVRGVLPMASALKKEGVRTFFVPDANREEAALLRGIDIMPVQTLEELIAHLLGVRRIRPEKPVTASRLQAAADAAGSGRIPDFSDVRGQEWAKRAIVIAAAGGHGILFTGSPGTGKTMLAERIPGILPQMTYDEILSATMVWSAAGKLDRAAPFIAARPFRSPHPRITRAGLLGGGSVPQPGEVSFASGGVLFLDEIAECDPAVIDALRIPLEKKSVRIIRRGESVVYPADFLFVAAMNPCRCGHYGDPDGRCTCSPAEVARYRNRISGPILDRIDLHVRLAAVRYEELNSGPSTGTGAMRAQVERARAVQRERFRREEIRRNADMTDQAVRRYAPLTEGGERLLGAAYERLRLDPRQVVQVRRISRTIADLEEKERITEDHVAEALTYRRTRVPGSPEGGAL